MRIALLSDIHANLPAFEAVLEDLERQKPDVVYCLGDLVGYNVCPNQVAGLIRSHGSHGFASPVTKRSANA